MMFVQFQTNNQHKTKTNKLLLNISQHIATALKTQNATVYGIKMTSRQVSKTTGSNHHLPDTE